ncbi:ATP-binding cassette domain-containing protein [Bacillus sp. m3-13]|uniref:ATP-binding cassette domain-containing protein n=1 Tax=Bacillus sp. m3-13 TaxID=406124 RepID=UPI0001E8945B|nr:ATP-binding cassette domain-containing protein [Bacillus sp. m3-13]
MEINLKSDIPIFQQVAELIESGILEGSMQEGERVPSTNEFAKYYQINPATAAKGINQLVDQEILFKKRGVGMFVAEGAKQIILTKRKAAFFKDYIVPLKKEASKLGITEEELATLIGKGGRAMKIEVKNVSKIYGNKKAVDNMSITLEENKIYGLLGRNGAGKTTLMQLLAGHALPSSGEILINGQNPFNNRNITKDICLVNESNNFIKRLKIKDILKVASLFYPNWSWDTANALLTTFNLNPTLKTKGLSKGMESSLGIIIGLASRAKITILDEPYIGLDAAARFKFYEVLLEEYEEFPRTIILSTHLIDEVSNLFEEVVLMRSGQLVFHNSTEELLDSSITVSGKKEAVDQFAEGKRVLHESVLAGRKTATLYGEGLTVEAATQHNLDAERSSIQQLMVYMTEEELQGGKQYA